MQGAERSLRNFLCQSVLGGGLEGCRSFQLGETGGFFQNPMADPQGRPGFPTGLGIHHAGRMSPRFSEGLFECSNAEKNGLSTDSPSAQQRIQMDGQPALALSLQAFLLPYAGDSPLGTALYRHRAFR